MTSAFYAVSAVRAMVEVAMFCLLGQGVLALLAGPSRDSNPIYRLFELITRPVIQGLRALLPAAFPERRLSFLAFFLLLVLWLLLAWLKHLV